jgi:hypothetical protein
VPPTEVIYTRGPEALKEAANTYASQQEASLTSTVAEPLESGLTAASDEASIASLEQSVAADHQGHTASDRAERREQRLIGYQEPGGTVRTDLLGRALIATSPSVATHFCPLCRATFVPHAVARDSFSRSMRCTAGDQQNPL